MRILYTGDASANLGPVFVASPFNVEVKASPSVFARNAGQTYNSMPVCRTTSLPRPARR